MILSYQDIIVNGYYCQTAHILDASPKSRESTRSIIHQPAKILIITAFLTTAATPPADNY
ncbi:MAG: hypothetical protein PHG20_03270 [Geobacteraceae bacterium]|nr:hypothetical protein [Geobacteraceae bacterium]